MSRPKIPPVGLPVLLMVGPSLVWCSEYIGSGEVILATRSGAVLGTTILWAVVSGIILKGWIGMSGARYTVATGEGMIDMISRVPGPRNWGVWIVLIGQFVAGALSIGSLATAAGVFLSNLLPISAKTGGWAVTVFALAIAWSGRFTIIKVIMSVLIFVVISGVLYVASFVFPGWTTVLNGLIPGIPEVPSWAVEKGINPNSWNEILPLIAWSAGGFASQVWYSYWVIGAGYGMTEKDVYGKPADTEMLRKVDKDTAKNIRGWFPVVYTDASLAIFIGVLVTSGFIIAGNGVLGPLKLAPEGPKLAFDLSNIFASKWGSFGGLLFMTGGTAALVSTQIGQLAGWPRLLADSFRICIPRFGLLPWKIQYRGFLCFFFLTNMIIVYSLGYKPVALIQTSAILDGLLLTPLQALWVFLGLYVVQPRLFSREVSRMLRPNWVFGAILIIAFLVFTYFCIWQIPKLF